MSSNSCIFTSTSSKLPTTGLCAVSDMLHIQVTASTASPQPEHQPTLADLSRNASVISSSSSSSSTSSLVVSTPRPRPVRTFSSPRSQSRDPPSTPRSARPPAYLSRELGLANGNGTESYEDMRKRAQSRSKSRARSRNSSVALRVTADDFRFEETLGEGSYSTVVRAIYLVTEQEYAVKILDKGHLKRHNKLQTAMAEKNTLVRLGSGHPGIVRLHWAFHDEWSLYFVLDLARNGELQSRISSLGSLSLACARYYAAQTIDAVAYMHSKGVIHRDLKPENLLLDDKMRIKITDFGTGKLLDDGVERTGTFVGTAQYVSPELLTDNITTKASDIWAVGCVIYQMIAGKFPFHALSEYLMWQKVKLLEYTFPDDFDEDAKDLVKRLLVIEPSQRLGAGQPGSPNDMDALRKHPFFTSINWSTLWTDPAPTMESGIFKKEPSEFDQNYDVGLAWDQLVGNDGDPPWPDDDGEFGSVAPVPKSFNGYPFSGGGDAVGPLDDVPPSSSGTVPNGVATNDAAMRGRPGLPALPSVFTSSESTTTENKLAQALEASHPVDIPQRGSVSTASTTSSSEGSPVDRLGSTLENMAIDRGRNPSTTPIQLANTPDEQWMCLMQPGEGIIFHSPVELKSRRRRLTASLLPIPVTQSKPKIRHLVLTTQRLVCVKMKSNKKVSVKVEALLRRPVKAKDGNGKDEKKDKDTRPVITEVVAKGNKTFIVMTTGKPQQFVTEPALAERWISEIRNLVHPDRQQPQGNGVEIGTSSVSSSPPIPS